MFWLHIRVSLKLWTPLPNRLIQETEKHHHSSYHLDFFLAMKLASWVDLGKVLTWLMSSFNEIMVIKYIEYSVELLTTVLNVEGACVHGKY